jgi:hypothetical protein
MLGAMRRPRVGFLVCCLLAGLTACRASANVTDTTDAGAGPASIPDGALGIATGTPVWVESVPREPVLNARVDVGTLHSVAPDQIEVVIEWPSAPGNLMSWRSAHPAVDLPDGTVSRDRERIVCRDDGPLSYRIESVLVAPDGRELARDSFDPAIARATAERRDAEFAATVRGRRTPYGNDSRSLACLAAASRCRGERLLWPPPPNKTPLEYSERADRMRAAYNAPFVPRCKL